MRIDVSEKKIKGFVREVVEHFSPEKIILFGSRIQVSQSPDSDVDILVVMETNLSPPDQATKIRLAVKRSFPMDLLVRSPEELKHRLAIGDPFFCEILEKGRVLYERGG